MSANFAQLKGVTTDSKHAPKKWGYRVGQFLIALLTLPPVTISHAWELGQVWDKLFVDPLHANRQFIADSPPTIGEQMHLRCKDEILAIEKHLKELSLAKALEIAICKNPQIYEALSAIEAQTAALGISKAAYWPTIGLNVSQVNTHTEYPGADISSNDQDGTNSGLSINWRLYDFGARSANSRSATKALDAALAAHDATLQKSLNDVVAAYFDAQTAAAVLNAQETGELITRQTLESARRKEARNASSQSETLQATAAFSKAALAKNRAMAALAKARAALVYAMGLTSGTPIAPADDFSEYAELTQDREHWQARARQSHPALLAARAQLAAAEERVAVAVAEGRPTLDLSMNYYENGRPNQLGPVKTNEGVASLTLNIPLFEGFGRTYKVRSAKAQVEQVQAQMKATENQVYMEIVKAHADALAAQSNLSFAKDFQRSSQEALVAIQRKFSLGATDISEVLNAQTMASEAQLEHIRTIAEWRSARLRLEASAGIFDWTAISPTVIKPQQ